MRPCRCGHLYSAHVDRRFDLIGKGRCAAVPCPCDRFEERR